MSNSQIQMTTRGKHADIGIVQLYGSLDTVAAYTFQEKVHTFIQAGVYKYILDLQHLEYISSAGIGVFPGMMNELQEHYGGIIFVHVPTKISKLFYMIGLTTLFPILETIEQALEQFDTDDE